MDGHLEGEGMGSLVRRVSRAGADGLGSHPRRAAIDGAVREVASAALVVFSRLFDATAGVAYGGQELSDRNLRVLDRPSARRPIGPSLSGTGNIHSGRMIVDYALRGCSSVQLHTFFQLPLEEYPATGGSRTQRALHALIFDPRDGLLAVMLEREAAGTLARRGGELHFLDLIGGN